MKSSRRILALLLIVSSLRLAAESPTPSPPESKPAETPPARLYTEEEVLEAADAAVAAALEVAVPLAVQAAVAEERGKTAAAEARTGKWIAGTIFAAVVGFLGGYALHDALP